MERDAAELRGDAPTLFASVLHGDGMKKIVERVRSAAKERRWTPASSSARPHNHDYSHED